MKRHCRNLFIFAFTLSLLTACSGGGSTTAGTGGAPPRAPTAVSVIAGNGQAAISWTNVAEATSYNVYYHAGSMVTIANGTKVAGAISPKTITNLANGTRYYFIVTAVNAGGESAVPDWSAVDAMPQASYTGTGTGTGAGTGTGISRVSGVVNTTALSKPSTGGSGYRHSPVGAGIVVKVYNQYGVEVGSAMTDDTGAYSIFLPQNVIYVIRVILGHAVMKAVVVAGTGDTPADLNPISTAIVLTLEKKLGVAHMGDDGVDFSTQIGTIDVYRSIIAITTNPNFSMVVTSVNASVAANKDPESESGAISAVNTIVITITLVPIGTGTGTGTGTTLTGTIYDLILYDVDTYE